MAANPESPQATWLVPTAMSEAPANRGMRGTLMDDLVRTFPNVRQQFPRRSPYPVPRGMDKRAP